jgi:hypothetical protein
MVYPRMGQMRLGYLTGQMLPGLAPAFGPGLPGPAGQQRPGSSRSFVGARCQDTGPEPSRCGLADASGPATELPARSATMHSVQGVWPRIRLIACADSSDFTKNPAAGLSAISSA